MKCLFIVIAIFTLPLAVQCQQVGIGTLQPAAGSILDISDTAHGVVLPRMGTAARLRLPDTKGMVVFDTVAQAYFFNDGRGWTNLPPRATNVGDMLFWNGTKWTAVAAGLGGQVLTLSTGTHVPVWKGATTDTLFIDPRDQQQYSIKQFGTQIWMTQNLNYNRGITYSWCYEYSAGNCSTYGRLYDYYGALQAVPPGWHLPSEAEWDTLVNFLGGAGTAGGAMKSTSPLWEAPNAGATNSSGFNALPGGWYYQFSVTGLFNFINRNAFFWTSATPDVSSGWARLLTSGSTSVQRVNQPWQDGLSVRCVKD